MPVSLREVAQKAGVSLSTVSRVLNDVDIQIAAETKERVRRAAQDLGYMPNGVARALLRRQMDTIGVVLPQGQEAPTRSSFFGILFDSLCIAAARHQQNVTLFTGQPWRNAETSLPFYRDGRCDGLLVLYQLPNSDILPALLQSRAPLVLINQRFEDERLTYVDLDDEWAGYEVTRYLLGLGHRRISVLTEHLWLTFAGIRIAGYRRALEEAGITPQDQWIAETGYIDETYLPTMQRLFSLPKEQRPTALFCLGDALAARTIGWLTRAGFRIPEDVSVVGFNDEDLASQVYPPLTTVRQPYQQIADTAVTLLLEQIQEIAVRGKKALLPGELVIRDSTGPVS